MDSVPKAPSTDSSLEILIATTRSIQDETVSCEDTMQRTNSKLSSPEDPSATADSNSGKSGLSSAVEGQEAHLPSCSSQTNKTKSPVNEASKAHDNPGFDKRLSDNEHVSECETDVDALVKDRVSPSFLGRFALYFRAWRRSSWTQPLTESLTHDSDEVSDTNSFMRRPRSLAPFVYSALCVAVAIGLILGLINRYSLTDVDYFVNWRKRWNVAFIGNAYLFVNDIPRVMEAISNDHIHQESVIHATSGSLQSLLLRGNGMYGIWNTRKAYLMEAEYTGFYESIYDYGLCTVRQLLLGYDDMINVGNQNTSYFNDGKNPCMADESYFDYTEEKLLTTSVEWDYVVLVDQTKRMALPSAREKSVNALVDGYAPLIAASGAIPVIVDTHAFWSADFNMTGLDTDLLNFQASIYEGVYEYVDALSSTLPEEQTPLIAPIGVAYLTIYEERPDIWEKLFIDDQIHASVHGSYLFACVLYGTMFGHLPSKHLKNVESLFSNSRELIGEDISYPTASEASYYRSVARRVSLKGHVPKQLQQLLDEMH